MRQMRLNSLSFAPSRHRSDETIIVTDKAVFLYLQVYFSYLEIDNDKIRDLLRPVPGVHLESLCFWIIRSTSNVDKRGSFPRALDLDD
jgi:hypothetical protein